MQTLGKKSNQVKHVKAVGRNPEAIFVLTKVLSLREPLFF